MKDNFSSVSSGYAKFRPGYPPDLLKTISDLCINHKNAWDCGTGSGQFAVELLKYFDKVYATDISKSQLEHAQMQDRISYSLQPAEQTNFPDHTFDLITVAQAIHWFNFEKFYEEVRRTIVPNGILVVCGYGLFRTTYEIDKIIDHFYEVITHPYWDKERHYIDKNYSTIPFPFEEIAVNTFSFEMKWNIQQVEGYLNTWSGVGHYTKANNENPVDALMKELSPLWKEELTVSFPVFARVGSVR